MILPPAHVVELAGLSGDSPIIAWIERDSRLAYSLWKAWVIGCFLQYPLIGVAFWLSYIWWIFLGYFAIMLLLFFWIGRTWDREYYEPPNGYLILGRENLIIVLRCCWNSQWVKKIPLDAIAECRVHSYCCRNALYVKTIRKCWTPWWRNEFVGCGFDNSEQFAEAVGKQMSDIQTERRNREAALPTFLNIGSTGSCASEITGHDVNEQIDESQFLAAGSMKKKAETLSVATGSTDPTDSLTDATGSDSILTDAETLA
jgi:hypothetical protein